MIPLWIKLLWCFWLILTWVVSTFTLSGLIVLALTLADAGKFHCESELIESVVITVGMVLIAIVSFVAIMLIYEIPFNQWIG